MPKLNLGPLKKLNIKIRPTKAWLIPSCVFLFLFSFVIHFPLSEKIDSKLTQELKKLPCLKYESYETHYFPPGLSFKTPTWNCRGQRLDFKKALLHLSWPNILPPALGVGMEIVTKDGHAVEGKFFIGWNYQGIQLPEQEIPTRVLTPFLPEETPNIYGNFTIDGKLGIKGGIPTDGEIHLKSAKLAMSKQNYMGFDLPEIPISPMRVNLNLKNTQGQLEANLGDAQGLSIQLQGPVEGHKRGFNYTQINLTTDLKFGPKLSKELTLFAPLLKSFEKSAGHYALKLSGTISRPKITPVK